METSRRNQGKDRRLTYSLRVGREAEQHIRRAADWWVENRPKAPLAFAEDLERAFRLATAMPNSGEPVLHSEHVGIRRLLMGRVRYYLYYRLDQEAERVEILALWHTSRDGEPPI